MYKYEIKRNQEDSGYFHNNKKLANRKSVKNAVLELQNSYQKYFEENKERICETDYTDETFETEKITLVSNPIHTGSKEPVVWYQLGELMKNAKNRVKIHTPYIICNDMMYNTYHVEPIELTKKRQRKIFLVQHLLGWQGICFNKEEGKRVSNIDCRR